jgi:peptide/nickel transport system substrate-binding protein
MNEEGIRLKRNNRYWRKDSFGNQLPFLASLSMKYAKDKNSELQAFEKNQVDIVLEVPVENVQDLFGSLAEAQRGKTIRHRIFSRKSSSINYLAFSLNKEPFNNIHVRKAFQLAIDRNKIVNEVLLGEGFPAINGFIPAMDGFVSDSTIKLPFDPERARQELAKAGFAGGVGFPSLKLWVNSIEGSSVSKWTNDIIAQLKTNLGINIQLQYCSFNEKTEAISRGDALVWRSGWVADYPDPESFLSIFYAAHATVNPFWGNISSNNSLFNENYEKSLIEQKTQNRIFFLNQCNKILMDEALVIPVYTDDFFVVLNLMLRDFQVNSLETMDLSMAYIKPIQ